MLEIFHMLEIFYVGAGAKPDSAGAKPDNEPEQNRIFDFDCEK